MSALDEARRAFAEGRDDDGVDLLEEALVDEIGPVLIAEIEQELS